MRSRCNPNRAAAAPAGADASSARGRLRAIPLALALPACLLLVAGPGTGPAADRAASQRPGMPLDAASGGRVWRLPIPAIQGAGHRSPAEGREVSTRGVVTALARRGFYLQDPQGDGDDATSDALFVYTGSAPSLAAGARVAVRGRVAEFLPGDEPANLTVTELVDPVVTALPSRVEVTPTVIGAGGRRPPDEVIDDDGFARFDPGADGIDFYESLEGMRVRVNAPLVVGSTSPFGEIVVVADGGAGAAVRSSAGGLVIRPGDRNPERVLVDDTLAGSAPDVRVGDRFSAAITGVVEYRYGHYRVLNDAPLPAVTPGRVAPEATSLERGPDRLTVATYNVLNLSPLDGGPGEEPHRLDRVADVIARRLRAPDVVALQEMQDVNGTLGGAADTLVDGRPTFAALIEAIAAAGGPRYAFLQIDPMDDREGGVPGGNIRVGYLYDPERVRALVRGRAGPRDATRALPGPRLSLSPGRVAPDDPAFAADPSRGFRATRRSLAVELEFNGHRLFMIVNHFKSKREDHPLFSSRQPPREPTLVQRIAQARVINDFARSLLALDAGARIIVLGDVNDFEFSPTLEALAGSMLTNLVARVPLERRYTFVHQGNGQALDHLLVSDALLAARPEVEIVHADTFRPAADPERASDHDPVVARFHLPAAGREAPD